MVIYSENIHKVEHLPVDTRIMNKIHQMAAGAHVAQTQAI